MQSTGQTSTQAESFVPMHGSVMTKGMPVSLYRLSLLCELDQVLRCASHEEASLTPGDLICARSALQPHDLRIPGAPVENLDRLCPQCRVVEPRCERDINAFLTPCGVLGAVEQHDVLLEIGVPVHG